MSGSGLLLGKPNLSRLGGNAMRKWRPGRLGHLNGSDAAFAQNGFVAHADVITAAAFNDGRS
jgi:hypothetical protein